MAVVGGGDGRKHKTLGDAGFDGIMPANKVVKLTKDDDADIPSGTARGIWSGGSGTMNFIDFTGETIADFPIFPGYNPIIVTRFLTGGTVNDIWAIY